MSGVKETNHWYVTLSGNISSLMNEMICSEVMRYSWFVLILLIRWDCSLNCILNTEPHGALNIVLVAKPDSWTWSYIPGLSCHPKQQTMIPTWINNFAICKTRDYHTSWFFWRLEHNSNHNFCFNLNSIFFILCTLCVWSIWIIEIWARKRSGFKWIILIFDTQGK